MELIYIMESGLSIQRNDTPRKDNRSVLRDAIVMARSGATWPSHGIASVYEPFAIVHKSVNMKDSLFMVLWLSFSGDAYGFLLGSISRE
jgi:hypothetical protein